jgi:hypothetical protein
LRNGREIERGKREEREMESDDAIIVGVCILLSLSFEFVSHSFLPSSLTYLLSLSLSLSVLSSLVLLKRDQ